MKELHQAQALIAIIKSTEPTDKIKDHIWVAKKHLSYESTETVSMDLIPIYASMDEIAELAPMAKVKEHINNAKANLEKGDKKSAGEELKLADEAVVLTEIDLPLGSTEGHVAEARMYLTKKESKKADTALKSAEDGVQFLSIMGSSPIWQARKSFWRASKNYMAGRAGAARADITEAKAYLARVDRNVDAKTRADARELLKIPRWLRVRWVSLTMKQIKS